MVVMAPRVIFSEIVNGENKNTLFWREKVIKFWPISVRWDAHVDD